FYNDTLFFACYFLNHILGGGGSSYLFRRVREKSGLCYSICSSYMGATGIIVIMCVLDPKDVKKGIKEIEKAVEDISNLDFDLEEVKKYFISSQLLQTDYLDTGIENYISDNYFLDTPKSKDEIMCFNKVTKEDILKVYKRLKKSFVYILGGKVDERI
ncbi:MAG: insulinase family protein, partial [Anaeroplasmataceae bacterium]|nr:insulinase family protein [Anaeroplasmataceae bacterium]